MKSLKGISKNLNALCKPAYFYFVVSVVTMMFMMIQNLAEGKNVLCLGEYKCTTTGAPLVFITQAIYILIWTKVLDMLCNRGLTSISWFLVLFPYILMFILLAIFILNVRRVKSKQNSTVIGMSNGLVGSYI